MAAAIVAYCGSYFVRGAVGGVRWFGGYGLLLFTDGAVRLLVALPLVFLASPTIAAIAVVLAALGGAVAPLLPRHRDLRAALAGANDETFDMRAALRFAAPMTVVAACEQLLVSGGPILVMLTGGEGAAAAAGVVFAATMLVRAPVFLFQGLSAALLPSLTRLDALGDQTRFRTAVVGTAAVLGAFSAALVLGAVAAGPQTMHLLYGSGFAVGRLDLSILCAGIGCYLLAATLSQAMLARGRAATAAAVWASGGALFVALELLLSGSPMHRVSVSFAAASTLMAVLFAALAVRRREPSGHTIAIPARGARSLAGTRGYGR
jgi:O-antigen/teichoic acid export membrane protein